LASVQNVVMPILNNKDFTHSTIVEVIGVVAINNVIHRYWKPVRIFTADSWSVGTGSARFAEPHELDKSQEPKVK